MQKSSPTADPPANLDNIDVEAETIQGTVIAYSTQAPSKQKDKNPSQDKSSQLWTAEHELKFLTTSFSDSADTCDGIHSYRYHNCKNRKCNTPSSQEVSRLN